MILHTIVRKFRGWQRYHEVLQQLGSLDQHMLNDIALQRGDFDRIAREAAEEVEAAYDEQHHIPHLRHVSAHS